jgi:hypothetical protein
MTLLPLKKSGKKTQLINQIIFPRSLKSLDLQRKSRESTLPTLMITPLVKEAQHNLVKMLLLEREWKDASLKT